MSHILVVEDEEIIRSSLKRLLEKNQYTVSEAGSAEEASNLIKHESFNLIITDLRLPGESGNTLVSKVAGTTPILVMTSFASLKSAVESMKLGAADYIAKPFDHDELLKVVSKTIKESSVDPVHSTHGSSTSSAATSSPTGVNNTSKGTQEAKQAALQANPQNAEGSEGFGHIIGECLPMQAIFKKISKVAPTDTTVLILGESGTGKELVAKALHDASGRASGSLISVNCAAIPETLIESELFGHEKGAFTGASSSRKGLVEAADGGTLFLDEIGELPLEAQARLLRLLQEKEIRKVGSVESRQIDVRLVAATHRDLKQMAAQGQFREDLYYRLHVVELQLPPLRDRGTDIIKLAEFFMSSLSQKRFHREPLPFASDALNAILKYPWPGNVRELENAIERALILCDESEVSTENLGIDISMLAIRQPAPLNAASNPSPDSAHQAQLPQYNSSNDVKQPPQTEELSLEDYFQRFVLENQDQMTETELAKKLGISRKCLWERRQRLGIPRKKNTSKQPL